MKKLLLILTILMSSLLLKAEAFDHNYSELEKFFKKNVVFKDSQSRVNYTKIKGQMEVLNSLTSSFSNVTEAQYLRWTENQKMAFLINAYNFFTIQLIMTKYPDLDSIKDLGGFFSSPWKKRFFKLFGKATHLDHLEHGLLRKKFNEPRIHFAIVCASESCPPLITEPFKASILEKQLEEVTINFMEDPTRNRYDSKRSTLYLSKLFKWFSEDFIKKSGSIQKFVAPYVKGLPKKKVKIRYMDYSWKLNDFKGAEN